MTVKQFQSMALSLPEVEERAHALTSSEPR